jgi:tetratricopeptide (TPR) repeat protein
VIAGDRHVPGAEPWHALAMTHAMARTAVFAAALVALSLAVAMPPVFAVEDMDDYRGDKKAGNAKTCPKGARYSEKRRGCVKTSCAAGEVWSGSADACLDDRSAALSDEDLYLAAGSFVRDGRYGEALPLLLRIKDRNQAQVLNLIGYTTRKLGDLDKGIDYYHQALALDPGYTKARQYLGEAYLLKGEVGKAKAALDEIAARCGGPCEDYKLLVSAIAAHVSGEQAIDW